MIIINDDEGDDDYDGVNDDIKLLFMKHVLLYESRDIFSCLCIFLCNVVE